MIVDRKGKIFENRRKSKDRRKNEVSVEKDKRKEDRRKEKQPVIGKK